MKIRTLVVEDEPMLCELVVGVLKARGHTVTDVNNRALAIKALDLNRFDLVLTDNDLIDYNDGFLVMQHARSFPCPPKVIWMSGRGDDPTLVNQALGMGACEVLPKPFGAVVLSIVIARVEQAIERATAEHTKELTHT